MRFFTLLVFIFIIHTVSGQKSNALVVKSGITKSKEKYFYYENDRHGNMVFSKNVGMNGSITGVFAFEYDSLNRQIKSFWVHSNLGFYIYEMGYENNIVKNYNYKLRTNNIGPHDREMLNQIRSRKEFIQMKVFLDLKNGKRCLNSIDYLDSVNNIVKEIRFSEKGDTTRINICKYNSKNQQTFYHYGTIGSENWTWDIYYLYDENFNKVKSFRISSIKGVKDTTEVHNYYYNNRNQLTHKTYYYNRKYFVNRTEYYYDKNGQVIKELFYERSKSNLDVKKIYRYDKFGNIKKEIVFDYREPKNKQKEVFKTTLEYW